MSILQSFSYISDYPLEFIFCVILALLPSLIWIAIFYKKHREKKSVLAYTFLTGTLSGAIILLYQYYWGQSFNFGFFYFEPLDFRQSINDTFADAIVIAFFVNISVGLLEEYSKHWITKKTDTKFFRSINDVIELSIVTALGFAFLENIGYFFRQIISSGDDGSIITLFVGRSTLVVFIHVLCSGIYGYFYGLGYFAKPIVEDEEKRKFFIPAILHRLFHWKKERVFSDEMASIGLIAAVLIHGIFNFTFSLEMSLGEILHITAFENLMFYHIVPPIILVFGFGLLNHLLEKKEDRKVFGHKIIREEFS